MINLTNEPSMSQLADESIRQLGNELMSQLAN